MQEFDKRLESLLLSHQLPTIVQLDLPHIINLNTRGSY